MIRPQSLRHPGILAALSAAILFGVGTPVAKWLLTDVSPWLLAGLLYAGSGVGLTLYRRLRRARKVRLPAGTWPWLCGAILAGGIVGLVLRLSLALFVTALRSLGTARTAAYFSIAPFFGAIVAIPLLRESVNIGLVVAGALMAFGVWLHLTERHEHEHTHEALAHEHEHVHDEHHRHAHDQPVAPDTRHSHWHRHQPQTHTHAHFPDAHHRHGH